MLQFRPGNSPDFPAGSTARAGRKTAPKQSGGKTREARVKPECIYLYPGVDPNTWYRVVQDGEYQDDMAGLWIQVSDWVTYVLAKHFDLQDRAGMH